MAGISLPGSSKKAPSWVLLAAGAVGLFVFLRGGGGGDDSQREGVDPSLLADELWQALESQRMAFQDYVDEAMKKKQNGMDPAPPIPTGPTTPGSHPIQIEPDGWRFSPTPRPRVLPSGAISLRGDGVPLSGSALVAPAFGYVQEPGTGAFVGTYPTPSPSQVGSPTTAISTAKPPVSLSSVQKTAPAPAPAEPGPIPQGPYKPTAGIAINIAKV